MIVGLTSSRASDGTSGYNRADVCLCGVYET